MQGVLDVLGRTFCLTSTRIPRDSNALFCVTFFLSNGRNESEALTIRSNWILQGTRGSYEER